MSDIKYFFICLICMAGITYLVRMLPLVLFRKKIKSRFLKSFFHYIPYAVLAAMTVPAILYSTSSVASAAAGLCVALLLAYFEQSLIVVAAGACIIVFIVERFI
ncbi:MAG: AzlD domain-containing protein [Ruminococcaceae bacterium]|nr:AzlD domain-containing protein [Oscillospiraceae bacterium]MBO4972007.1 AzlD domain-containing protein [Clostridia bacterium]MBQ1258915.1 AzlD domain-containing protein [Clostridia bacterium]